MVVGRLIVMEMGGGGALLLVVVMAATAQPPLLPYQHCQNTAYSLAHCFPGRAI